MTKLQSTRNSAADGPTTDGRASEFGRAYRPFEHDPSFSLFARARVEAPVFWCDEIGYWVVTRREDIAPIFQDPDTFGAEIALSPVADLAPEAITVMRDGGFDSVPVQVNCNPPTHSRVREIAGTYLNAKQYRTLEPYIRTKTVAFLDAMEGKGQVDLVADLAYDLPALVIFQMMGIPDADVNRIKRWANNRLLLTFGQLTTGEQMACARDMVAYWDYCRELVAARLVEPQDDYPSALLRERNGDDDVLTIKEIESLVFGLLLAGHETTTNQTGNAFRMLLTHPEAWQAICADPKLIPNAIEETLRFQASVVCWRRRATRAVTIGGVEIPADANLLLATASASRDESNFVDGERFDIHRRNAREHLAFGSGIHF
ncbi:MAG: cytochrome P450, partial [Rhodospirillaceae bacterium]|nr:cytochrome P450 [Rhodospirillaceae bacterium]